MSIVAKYLKKISKTSKGRAEHVKMLLERRSTKSSPAFIHKDMEVRPFSRRCKNHWPASSNLIVLPLVVNIESERCLPIEVGAFGVRQSLRQDSELYAHKRHAAERGACSRVHCGRFIHILFFSIFVLIIIYRFKEHYLLGKKVKSENLKRSAPITSKVRQRSLRSPSQTSILRHGRPSSPRRWRFGTEP